MSNTLALATVTATLRHGLDGALNAAAAANEGVVGARTVSGLPGSPAGGATAGAYVYLYRVTRQPNMANDDLPTRDSAGRLTTRPRVPLCLRYLIACFGNEGTLEPSRVLGVITSHVDANPVLTPAMIQAAQASGQFPFLNFADLDEAIESVRLTWAQLDDEALNRLWGMLPTDKFALSVVYDASVVIIERPVQSSVAFPVLQRGALTVLARQPVITAIEPASGTPGEALHPGDNALLLGSALSGTGMRLEIDGTPVPAAAISEADEDRIRVIIPASTLAGPRVVQVIHDFAPIAPSLTVQAIGSAPYAVVLRPDITLVARVGGNVRVDVATIIAPTQLLEIVLNLQGGVEVSVRAGSLVAPTRVEAPLAGLTAGTYLVRLRIDGIESVPRPPGFAMPTVLVP